MLAIVEGLDSVLVIVILEISRCYQSNSAVNLQCLWFEQSHRVEPNAFHIHHMKCDKIKKQNKKNMQEQTIKTSEVQPCSS